MTLYKLVLYLLVAVCRRRERVYCECGSCTNPYPRSDMVVRHTGSPQRPIEYLHRNCYRRLYGNYHRGTRTLRADS